MFYIQAPKGLITLNTLEDIVFTRLKFLSILDSSKDQTFTGKFEYLLADSPYDYIGHFTLRLLTLKYNDFFLSWLDKETLLFKKRLSLISPKQLYKLFKIIIRHLKRREKTSNPVDDVLIKICSFYIVPKIFNHAFSKTHPENCTKYCQKIDFELLPDLVETKCVDLSKGSVVTYCSQWKQVFQSLFQTFILFEVKTESKLVQHFLSDPRINTIHQKFHHSSFAKSCNLGNITAFNIDNEAKNFPPCMEHLYRELKQKHRLSHYARFYYTLYLKECGMSLDDAIVYWKSEYCKPHNCNSSCTHDWHKDAKKFIYSIRHMYGLEGGRKNYKTPNCQNICEEIPSINYEGGCPFKNFDIDSLNNLMSNSMSKIELNELQANCLKARPQEICANYFKLKSTKLVYNVTITNPVQYYKEMIALH